MHETKASEPLKTRLSASDICEIAEYLDCGNRIFINTATLEYQWILDWDGMIDQEFWVGELAAIEDEWDDFVIIEKMDSHEAYGIMEAFAETVPDTKLQEDLFEILSRRKPFANFRAEMDESVYRERWFAFKDARYEAYVRTQLDHKGIPYKTHAESQDSGAGERGSKLKGVLRPVTDRDRSWIAMVLNERWGSPTIVARGQAHRAHWLDGVIAEFSGERVGVVMYRFEFSTDADTNADTGTGTDSGLRVCEIVSLDSLRPGLGIGTGLIDAVKDIARTNGCKRLICSTTNDNLAALGFYQRRGFRLVAVVPGAMDHARSLKPEIPKIGRDGIAIRDELVLETRVG